MRFVLIFGPYKEQIACFGWKSSLISYVFLYPAFLHPVSSVQPADIGLPTGNGKNLSCSQAQLGQATGFAVA